MVCMQDETKRDVNEQRVYYATQAEPVGGDEDVVLRSTERDFDLGYLVVWIFVQTFQFHLHAVLFLTGPFYLDRNLSRGKVHHGDNIQFVYFLHIFDFSSFQ